MDETFVSQVDTVLSRYDQRREELQARLDAIEQEGRAFLGEFSRFRERIAGPLFETVAQHLRDHGHDCDIEQLDYEVSQYGKARDASITLMIFPAATPRGSRPAHEFPSFGITASKDTQLVRFHSANTSPKGGGSSPPRGELNLSVVTAQLVQRELLKVLGDVFGIPRG